MLARLARWLRLLGADTLYDPALGGAAMLARARAEGRVMLTRDKRLRTATDVLYLESNDFRGQLREVMRRYPFDRSKAGLSRCSRCNRVLVEVGREAVVRRVPAFVYASNERFAECLECGRIYWGASHVERMKREMERIGL